jgi:flagella basal body P-ring formation protein FlgA
MDLSRIRPIGYASASGNAGGRFSFGSAENRGMDFAPRPGMMQRSRKTVIAACCLLAAGAAGAEREVQSHASIRAAVERHATTSAAELAGRAEVEVGRLDSRLRLSACDIPLTTFDSPNGLSGGRGVVGVRCDGSSPWKIYVPVDVALLDEVVVTRNPVARGQTLQADDLMLREVDIARERKPVYRDVDDVVGLRSKRALDAGDLVHAGLLKRARLVRRGASVQIIARLGSLEVSMHGEALSDGGRGDRIRVRNRTSGRVVTGTVVGRGVIEVLE